MPLIHHEQAVYGSFPFWDRGYALLGSSPGCPDSWVRAFILACQRYGEPPRGVSRVGGVFTAPLGDGAIALIGPSLAGSDDHGRPRALAFHGIFLDHKALSRLGGLPHLAARQIHSSWDCHDRSLASGLFEIPRRRFWHRRPVVGEAEQLLARLLLRGRKVAIESPEPVDELVSTLWPLLGDRARRGKTFATWAFSNDNRFDLIAAPRLHGLDLDPGAIVLPADPAESLRLLKGHMAGVEASWLSRLGNRRRRFDESTPIAD